MEIPPEGALAAEQGWSEDIRLSWPQDGAKTAPESNVECLNKLVATVPALPKDDFFIFF